MDLRKAGAVYALVVGVSIIGMWSMLLATGNVPEVETEPFRLGAHVAAEFAAAGLLIAGGIGLLGRRAWGGRVFLLALGMLLYSLILSPGYYLELGVLGFVLMFAVLLVIALLFAAAAVKGKGGLE